MNENDPTQTGGAEATPNTRNSAEEQIAERVHNALAPEFNQFNEDTGEITPNEQAPEPAAETADTVAADSAPEAPAPATKMVSITVDGQAIEVEEARILEAGKRTLQKESAADKRLQEAVRKEQEAQRLLDRAQQLSPRDAAPQAPSQDAPTPAATFSPEMLETVLEHKLYARDAEKAAAKFREDFPEIAADPHLMNMAITLENQRLATVAALQESPGDPFDAYRKHGETIQQWMAKFKPPAPQLEDKAERKRTITAIPAANARAPVPKADAPMTIAQLIEEQRKGQGSGRISKH